MTPYAGVREDWVENNWGYKEVAYQINKPTLEICLGNKTPRKPVPTAGQTSG